MKNGKFTSVGSGGWLGPSELKVGYYWCRLGAADAAPTIVKIDDQQSPDELALWEFGCGEWQSVLAYGNEWQFLPVSCPNVADQPRAESNAKDGSSLDVGAENLELSILKPMQSTTKQKRELENHDYYNQNDQGDTMDRYGNPIWEMDECRDEMNVLLDEVREARKLLSRALPIIRGELTPVSERACVQTLIELFLPNDQAQLPPR